MTLGDWEGMDVPLDSRVLEVAGNDDRVYRRYVNAATSQAVDVYVAYAARPVKMLGHRPEVCYPAHGWTPIETRRETLRLAVGSELPYLFHRFTRAEPTPQEILVLNYYILRGKYITDWTDFWGPASRLPNLSRDPGFGVTQVQLSTCVPVGTARDMRNLLTTLTTQLTDHLEDILFTGANRIRK
jgi:hypothetical protein